MLLIKKENPNLLLFINKLNDHSWMAQSDDQPQEDFARFGYKTSRFLECFEIMLYFCYLQEPTIFFFFIWLWNFQKNWHILADFVKENETSIERFGNILFVKMKFSEWNYSLAEIWWTWRVSMCFLTNILQSKNVKVLRRYPSLE
jgi:hypothetical protein